MNDPQAMRAARSCAAAAALAMSATACVQASMPASVRHPLAGATAPPFDAVSTSSRGARVPGGSGTKVTVVDFWASWCAACRTTMPELEELYNDRGREGLDVIGVSVDERAADARAMSHRLRMSFPIVLDPRQRIAERYQVGRIPLTFVIDGEGTVRWVGREPAEVRRAVEMVLAE